MTDVLLIDPNRERREKNQQTLTDAGFSVVVHDHNAQQAESLPQNLSDETCIVAVSDTLGDAFTALSKEHPIVVLADPGSIAEAVAFMRRGANDYIGLPVEPAALVAAVERACAHFARSVERGLTQFPLVGNSPQMQELKTAIEKAGPTTSTVLIQGASGTGKALVARAVHSCSDRAHTPLININCATIPHNFIESELFGMGESENDDQFHAGLVLAANRGTLFLDEIAELPESAQGRLLRVLDGENRRVGSSITERVDVRIIAATHRDLKQLVEDGQFREDLYFRLNVVQFQLPPLNKRGDDVIELAEWLLQRTSERLNKDSLSFSDEALQTMRAYHWPGNVRELENAIERAVILGDANTPLTPSLLAIEVAQEDVVPPEVLADGDLTSLEDYFVKFVLQHQDQLTETELAEKLGISRKSLWERRQRLNIPRRKTKKRGPRQDTLG